MKLGSDIHITHCTHACIFNQLVDLFLSSAAATGFVLAVMASKPPLVRIVRFAGGCQIADGAATMALGSATGCRSPSP